MIDQILQSQIEIQRKLEEQLPNIKNLEHLTNTIFRSNTKTEKQTEDKIAQIKQQSEPAKEWIVFNKRPGTAHFAFPER